MADPDVPPASGHPVTFRAGRGPSEHAGPAGAATPAEVTAGPSVLLADVSEFQSQVSAAYFAWSQAVVIRAAYGTRTDRAWYGGQRRAFMHSGGARFVGIYQYLTAAEDPVAQASALVSVLGGRLEDGEAVICDLEEGAGNQRSRLDAWAHVITDSLGDAPWDYSGLYFSRAAGIAPVDWVAAYQSTEPSVPHRLWQFTDAFAVPGAGTCDCSVFRGTIDQLAALAHGGTAPPSQTWTDSLLAQLAVLQAGSSGADVRSAQGLLGARGFAVSIDGSYGPVTRAAASAFQYASGLAADGTCGPATWRKLAQAEAGATLLTIGNGDTGDAVRSVQGLLCARGYATVIDGSYGPVTAREVVALQQAAGIAADGITGPDTWHALLNR